MSDEEGKLPVPVNARFMRELRERVHRTQLEFARKLGVHRNTVVKWEQDGESVQIGVLAKVAKAFNLDVNELIDRPATRRVPPAVSSQEPKPASKSMTELTFEFITSCRRREDWAALERDHDRVERYYIDAFSEGRIEECRKLQQHFEVLARAHASEKLPEWLHHGAVLSQYLGDHDRAIEQCNEGLATLAKLHRGGETVAHLTHRRARVEEEACDYQAARRDYELASRLKSEVARPHERACTESRLASLLENEGKIAAALEIQERCWSIVQVSENPDHVAAVGQRFARSLRLVGDFTKARFVLAISTAAASRKAHPRAILLNVLEDALLSLQQQDQYRVIELTTQARAILDRDFQQSGSPEATFHLGLLCQAAGDKPLAKTFFTERVANKVPYTAFRCKVHQGILEFAEDASAVDTLRDGHALSLDLMASTPLYQPWFKAAIASLALNETERATQIYDEATRRWNAAGILQTALLDLSFLPPRLKRTKPVQHATRLLTRRLEQVRAGNA